MCAVTNAFDLTSLKGRLRQGAVVTQPREGPPVAAVAIIINPNDRGGSILLIKRTGRQGDPWSGQTAFPGGRKAAKDVSFLETAIREAREEVGIALREHELLGSLPLIYTHTRRVQVVPYVFLLKYAAKVRRNAEVAESFWAPLSVMKTIEVKKTDVQVEEDRLNVDAYVYDGQIIWGLTFRIINILVNRRNADNL